MHGLPDPSTEGCYCRLLLIFELENIESVIDVPATRMSEFSVKMRSATLDSEFPRAFRDISKSSDSSFVDWVCLDPNI